MTDKRLITPEDLYRMHWVNDPVVSPASGAIAYVHKSVSEKFDGYRSHIRLLPAEGNQDVPFTSGEADAAPAWSPDGSELAFLRKKGDKPQIWIMPANGGEARPVTDLKHGVSAFKWSPDCTRLLVKGEADAGKTTEGEELDKDGKNKLPEEKIINRIKYKADGPGLWNERRHHLYLVNPATEECTQITEGDFDIQAFAWSPDGTRIAYSSSLATEQFPDPDLRLTDDVFVMDLASGSVTELTDGTLSIGSIAFTPDGQYMLVLASDLSCGFATLTKIHLIPLSGGESRVLFTDMDIQLGHAAVSDMRAGAGTPPLFSRDGQSVYIQLSPGWRRPYWTICPGRFIL